jgi:hypothetical protein
MTVLLSWLLFCLALGATRIWAKTRWPYVALVVVCTPVLIFSSGIVAPNGPEMMAALVLWTALIGLLSPSRRTKTRGLLCAVAVSGALLATLRSLGPVFCVLILGTVLLTTPTPVRVIHALMRRRSSWLAFLVVLVSGLQSIWWILSMGSLDVSGVKRGATPLMEKLSATCVQALLWIFQSIAAFPFRDEPASPWVYFCYLVLFGAVMVLAVRRSRGSLRVALFAACAISILFPFLIAIATYDTYGGVWQGRYGLPYSIGMVVLAGLVLDRRAAQIPPHAALGALALFVTAQTMGPVGVLLNEAKSSPLRNTSAWLEPSPYVLGVGAVAAASLMFGAAIRERARAA